MPIQRKVGLPVDASWECCPFSQGGALTTKVGTSRFPITGGTFRIQTVAVAVGTAPTGAALIVDVNKNETSIFGVQANRPWENGQHSQEASTGRPTFR